MCGFADFQGKLTGKMAQFQFLLCFSLSRRLCAIFFVVIFYIIVYVHERGTSRRRQSIGNLVTRQEHTVLMFSFFFLTFYNKQTARIHTFTR